MQAARALGWLIAASAAVRVVSYGRLTRAIARIPRGRSSMTPAECATAIRRAAQIWPAACLPQAIAGYCLLQRAGLAPAIELGVARDGHGLDAHAWLECDGVIVTGGDMERAYAPLPAPERPSP